MYATPFDTFQFIRRLRDAGIPENQAEAISEAIKEIRVTQFEGLVTKRDLKDLEGQLATKADVTRMDMHVLELKRDIKDLEYRMTIRLGLMLVAVSGMLFTALRYFPPTQPIVISSQSLPAIEQNLGRRPAGEPPTTPHPAP